MDTATPASLVKEIPSQHTSENQKIKTHPYGMLAPCTWPDLWTKSVFLPKVTPLEPAPMFWEINLEPVGGYFFRSKRVKSTLYPAPTPAVRHSASTPSHPRRQRKTPAHTHARAHPCAYTVHAHTYAHAHAHTSRTDIHRACSYKRACTHGACYRRGAPSFS